MSSPLVAHTLPHSKEPIETGGLHRALPLSPKKEGNPHFCPVRPGGRQRGKAEVDTLCESMFSQTRFR